jgi:hypothetical protein
MLLAVKSCKTYVESAGVEGRDTDGVDDD